jgi:glucose/arabinose dehydrogenase
MDAIVELLHKAWRGCHCLKYTCGWLALVTILAAWGERSAQATEAITVGRLRIELQRVINRPNSSILAEVASMDTAGDGSGKLYLGEIPGRIRSYQNGAYGTFLDATDEVMNISGPRGLLGFAFHPGYTDSGSVGYRKMYTYFSVPTPSTPVPVDFSSPGTVTNHNVLIEWQLCDQSQNPSCTPGTIDKTTRREVFRQAHVGEIHDGGMLEFGPDGYLYGHIGTPPSGTNPQLQAQNLSYLNGKIFKIDPIHPSLTPGSNDLTSVNGKYRVPDDNPFVNTSGALDEIWASGLRHAYRFSIDPETNLLFAGDVGQGTREEVSVIPAGGNMGWPHREGTIAGTVGGGTGPFVEPLSDYAHSDGRAVIGGYVYRGSIPALQGKYIFAEFSWKLDDQQAYNDHTGRYLFMDPFDELGNLKPASEQQIQELALGQASCAQTLNPDGACLSDMTIYSLGIDDDGEIYAMGFGRPRQAGRGVLVYKVTDAFYIPEGDYDEDGTVDNEDLLVWKSQFGMTQVHKGYGADGNRDGLVDAADYVIWRKHLGETGLGAGQISSLPEPSSLVMAALALVTIVGSMHRRRPC